MALSDKYDLSPLKNQMEKFVFNELELQLGSIPDEDICKCGDCILDMACFVLNKLGPKYHSSLIGAIYTQEANFQESQDIQEKVRKAIEAISQHPLCNNFH